MNAQQFLAEFGHLVQAPNGVTKLRELVLVLAVQGRLLQQMPGEDAEEILEAIDKERQSLIASRTLRSQKHLSPINEKELAHEVPGNWRWTRFGEIALHNSGKTLDSVRNSGYPRPYITTSNLHWGRFELSNIKQMLIRDEELEKCTARKGDLLICEGGEAGRAAVWVSEQEICFQNHVHRARFLGKINPFFAYRFFEKLNMTGEINQYRKGIGISNMSSTALAMIPFPLPPLAEQDRIVTKVDELMALCDQLEQQQKDCRKLQNALRQSALQSLASAQGPHQLQASWQRLQDNFEYLAVDSADVGAFRQAILQLAVRGRLVSQNQQDEIARELLKRIAAERVRLVKEGKISKPKLLPPVTEADVPFHVPDGWAWARFADVANIASNLVEAQNHPAAPHVAPDNVEKGSGRLLGFRTVAEDGVRSSKHQFYPGQILYSKIRPNLSKVVIVDFGGLCSADMYPIDAWIDRRYLHCYMLSGSFLVQVVADDNRLAMPKVNQEQLSTVLVPVPPLDEQRRIIVKVDQLMQLCDKLEKQLHEAGRTASRLAISSISALTGMAIERGEDTDMKVPQTELIAPLRLAASPSVKAQAPLATILARHQGEMPARDLFQRFGGEIDAFYAQLKTEVAQGWIAEPSVAEVREKQVITEDA